VLEFPSGTEVGNWTVPEEWVVRDAWVKYKGKKILDYKKQPLSLVVGSLPFKGMVTRDELAEHLHVADHRPDDTLYEFKFYEKDWGFSIPWNKVFKKGKDGVTKQALKEGEYEVFIDTEYKPGVMKVATHTILGKTDKEILLFAHLDHPFQANDNLSGVAALVDLVKKIKPLSFEHTIKLVFCPETIGSNAYVATQNLDNVSFVIALDIVGNSNEEGFLFQKSFDTSHRVNAAAHLALRGMGEGYRQGIFRSTIGSDEYAFNDPAIGVPGILLTSYPYDEYHTSADTPEKIDYKMIEKAQRFVLKTIEYYEKDFIPQKMFTGPLFRSKYGIQTPGKQLNLSWDYLIYSMDGERAFTDLCVEFGLNFEHTYDFIEKLVEGGAVGRWPIVSQGDFQEIAREEY